MHPHLHAQNRTVKPIYIRVRTWRTSERVNGRVREKDSEHKCVRTYLYTDICTEQVHWASETQSLGMRKQEGEGERLQNGTKNQSDWRRWIDGIRIRSFQMYTEKERDDGTHAHTHIIVIVVVVVVAAAVVVVVVVRETENLYIVYFRSRSLMPKNRFSGYTCSVLCILGCSIIELSTWIEIVLGKVVVQCEQCLVCWFCFWGAQWCQILLATTKEFLDKVCELKKSQH